MVYHVMRHPRITVQYKKSFFFFNNRAWSWGGSDIGPVSYTHLDVYKRQALRTLKRARYVASFNPSKTTRGKLNQDVKEPREVIQSLFVSFLCLFLAISVYLITVP